MSMIEVDLMVGCLELLLARIARLRIRLVNDL